MHKVLVHSRPGYSVFLREIIRQTQADRVDWSVVSFSNSDLAHAGFEHLLGAEHCLDLQQALNRRMLEPTLDLTVLRDLPASVFQCLETSKDMPGIKSLIYRDRTYQLRLVAATYLIYKEFLLRIRPDFVFFPLIEFYDAVILYHLCHELGIEPVVYTHGRNLGVSYFSDNIYESLPRYAMVDTPDPAMWTRARAYIQSARGNLQAAYQIQQVTADDALPDLYLPKRRLWQKVRGLIGKRLAQWLPIDGAVAEPHLIDRFTVWNHILVHFMPLTIRWRAFKGRWDRRQYDITQVGDLPRQFVYFPLQLTPEASINIPAPIFINQIHAIDWILNSLPPDHFLVVKEHPAMRGCRPPSFYRELRKRAALLLCDYAVPGRAVIERAALTISVTGTSCLEAFILGKASLHMGRAAFSDWIWRGYSPDELTASMRQAIAANGVPDAKIEEYIARAFMVGKDFVLFAPDNPYLPQDMLFNRTNMRNFLACFIDHLNRVLADVADHTAHAR